MKNLSTYFKNEGRNYIPIVKATLCNPLNNKAMDIELVIDTGFRGGVLLPLKLYVDLGLYLFEEPRVFGKTATGNIVELRVSKVIVKIGGLEMLCNAYTSLGVKKSLIGREVLRKTGLLYKPPKELKIGV